MESTAIGELPCPFLEWVFAEKIFVKLGSFQYLHCYICRNWLFTELLRLPITFNQFVSGHHCLPCDQSWVTSYAFLFSQICLFHSNALPCRLKQRRKVVFFSSHLFQSAQLF